MKVSIYSRRMIEDIPKRAFPKNTAVISFYEPQGDKFDFSDYTDKVFQIPIYDIGFDDLEDFNLTEETFFPEADKLAKFIHEVKENGMDIICQCEYGQSRSAGCAAAIAEYYYHNGIEIFADYRYCPNQLIYNKIYDALKKNTEVE